MIGWPHTVVQLNREVDTCHIRAQLSITPTLYGGRLVLGPLCLQFNKEVASMKAFRSWEYVVFREYPCAFR